MTTTATISFEILSHWHVGSGRGRGGDVDALVIKDEHGLPHLPGRAVKGLLREGLQIAEDAQVVPGGRTNEWCGKPAPRGRPDGSEPGLLSFSDARLPAAEQEWLASPAGQKVRDSLYDRFASTALDAHGMAKDKTLRAIELCVPITVEAAVHGPADKPWLDDLQKAATFIRGLGAHRHRGLGRCRVTVRPVKEVAPHA